MNHRYAYCSKDQDPDQDHEEMPFTPGAGNSLGRRISDDTPLSIDETQTPHSFLSDSSLDGAPEALKEEDEEVEEKEAGGSRGHGEEAHVSLSGEQLEGSPVQESITREHRYQHERNSSNVRNHADSAESHMWDPEDQSGDLNKCEPSLDITDLPRIKT